MFACVPRKNEHCSQVSPSFSSLFLCLNFAFLQHHLLLHKLHLYFVLFYRVSLCYPSLFVLALTSSPSLLAVLLLLNALFYLSPMCVIPSPLLPSNNSVQISVRHWVPKCNIYQDKHKINIQPTQTQHAGSSADLPMTLAPTLQLSSVITKLKQLEK